MTVKEVELTYEVAEELISLSEEWEKEGSCHGYRKNTIDDINGNRIFLAVENNVIAGYLFGHNEVTDKALSICQAGAKYFEIEELYVGPKFRNQGIGKNLFQYVEKVVADQADMIMLSTATKNFRAILHFYIDELGMEFWSARLFKRLTI